MREIVIQVDTTTLSNKIHGFTVSDGHSYKIWINDILDSDNQAAAFLHEMLHIWNDDFNKDADADHIEKQTHAQLKRISEIYFKEGE